MKKRYSLATLAVFCASTLGLLFSTTSFAQIPSYVPANGLVAWYPFNGNANDESGNGNNGVVNGAVLTEDRFGNASQSYNFNGNGNYINVPFSSSIAIQQQFSSSVWVNMNGGSCNPRVYELHEVLNCGGFGLSFNGTSNTSRTFHSAGFGSCTNGSIGLTGGNNAVPANSWHHVVAVFNGITGNGKLYIDGLQVHESTGSQIGPINYYGASLCIGNIAPNRCDWWGGKIDDLAFYNRALTEAEVQSLYTSQSTPTCNLGSIATPESTICAGESISLVAQPAVTADGCFNPKVKQAGNQNFGITSTHRDAQGNYYMSGAYSGATTIDGIAVPSIGNRDIFLAKYNSCGQIQWVTRGGSSGDQDFGGDGSHGIATDADGNVYIVGRYNQAFTFYGANSTTFGAPWTSTSNGNHQDGFLVKLNSSGQVVWGASLRGTSNDGFVGVAVDGAGNPVVTGGFNGCCPSSFAVTIFGPNGSVPVSSFGSNYGSGLVVKFDANGNILWKAAVYNRDTGLGSVAIDGSNNIYLTSNFRSWSNGTAAQFIDAAGANNSLFNPGIGLGFLVKLNSSGNWQWGTTFGNVGDGVGSLTSGADVAVDAAGNPWVVGYFRGAQATVYSTNGANLTIPASTNDIGFLISYNAAGVAQSVVTRQQSTASTYYRSLAIANDKIVVAGHFTGANAGANDILLANYSATGAFIDAQTAGGAGEDYALSIIPSNSEFAVCGSTAGGFALDGVSVPSACTYLWNLGAGQGQAIVSWSNVATSPTIEVSPEATTTYTATFSDGTNSCSQEVVVNVNQPSSSAIEATIMEGESYDFNSQSLTTAGTYEAVLVNAAGCDSTVTLTLSVQQIPLDCNINSSSQVVCMGENVQLEVTSSVVAINDSCSWTLVNTGDCYRLIPGPSGKLFISRRTDVLKSTNNGISWSNANWPLGIVRSGTSLSGGSVYNFQTNQYIQCALDNGYWVSNNDGDSFVQTGPTGFGCAGVEMLQLNSGLVLGTMGGFQRGVYKSNNLNNTTWTNRYAGVDPYDFASFNDSVIFSATSNNILKSTNQGDSWTSLFSGTFYDVEKMGDSLVWVNSVGNVFVAYLSLVVASTPSRSNLQAGYFDVKYDSATDLLIASKSTGGLFFSSNHGHSWTACEIPGATSYYDLTIYENNVYVGTNVGLYQKSLNSSEIIWSTGETTPSITVTPTETTTYSVTVTQGAQTCTSDVTINVNQPSSSAIEATITEGESYDFNGQSLTTAGTYEAVLVNAAGCDSTVTLTLSVEAVFDCSITASDLQVCEGESVTLTSAAADGVPSVNYSLDFPNTAQYSGSAQAVGSTNKDGFNLTGDFTIEFWIKAEGSFYWHLMGKNTFGNNSQGWLLKKPGANLGIGWTYVPNEFDFHSFNFGNWEHVAICFDDASNTFRYFKNGVLTTTQARDININASPYDLVIGHELGTGNWFDGKLDNLRISNVSRYSGNFNPTQTFVNDASTVAMYDFNEGSGNVAQDISGNGRVLNLFNTNYSADVPSGSAIDQSALTWSTGSQEQSITVAPESSTTYFVTYDDGTTACQDSITITVLPNETYYADADGDGFGNFEMPLTTCDVVIPDGYTLDNTDCNDSDALNYPFASCDDGDPCTIEDVIQLDCTCAGFFADSDEDGTCDANDLCQGGLEPGTPCDDGEPCTVNDVIQSDCFCFGTVLDVDNDGVCDIYDACNGAEPGTACDDNDPCTVNDIILADCTCTGTFADADNDGTCDANDNCAGPETGTACDDNDPCTVGDAILADCSCAGTFADADNDGTCDANDNCAGPETGTACDDNDPCTVGDAILADCTCAGTFADADNDGTCDANDLCAGPEAGTACDDNDPCTVNDIIREDCSCLGVYIDSDEDGVCDANDLCAGPEAGSICDDNDPCTVDDVILADCSCAGTIADSDNDGVCDAFDLCFGPEPGSNCDDGNPCTINDVVNEACTCIGEPVAVNTSITSATACDSYVWNGEQYTASGTYTIQITNAAGCDSLATLVLEIRQSSFAPQSASASLTTITAGQSVTLTVVGGSLGTDAQWMWYSGSCGGTLIGQGASISASPSATTTYFVRAVGECNTTACASVTVNVSALPCGPQTISASSTSICAGNAVTLSVTGVLSTGAVWKWYKNGCGLGTSVGTGATIAVIPTTNTSYFVRAEGGSCGLTSCLSVAITVASVPAKPTVITGPNAALCSQQGVVYSTPQLAGVNSYLWTVPSGATIVNGQGTSSITVNFSSSISPNSTCGYTGICVSALNGCGASLHHCMQVSLTPGAPAGIVASASVCRFQEATFSVLNPIAGMSYTWEVPNNWQILSGQGTSTITAMVGLNNGQVRVYATNTCGMSKKFSRFVGPINCNRSETSLQLDVWPNPASQNVKFTHGGIQPEILEIYDLLGREIYRGDWVGEWNVETLEAGVYFVRVTHQGESVVKRLEVAR